MLKKLKNTSFLLYFILFLFIFNCEYVNCFSKPTNPDEKLSSIWSNNIINDHNPNHDSIDNNNNNNNNGRHQQHTTQYKYKTIQIGSAIIPYRGATVHVSPDYNKTKSFITKTDTTIINPGSGKRKHNENRRSFINNNNNNNRNSRNNAIMNEHRKVFIQPTPSTAATICVKCPMEQILIAQRRLDGVLIESPSPQLLSCNTNQPFSKSLFEIQTLFGTQFKHILLPQGTHSFIGKIKHHPVSANDANVNDRATSTLQEEYEQTCLLNYRVIVRKCPRYRTTNRNLKIKCDLENIWGSKCQFSCRNTHHILNHNNQMVCNDDLKWIGIEPICRRPSQYHHNHHNNNHHQNQQQNNIPIQKFPLLLNTPKPCEYLIPPENGKLSCKIKENNKTINQQLSTNIPSGSICKINCNSTYDVPASLNGYTIFYCLNGQWNSTMYDFCQQKNQRASYV